MKTTRSLQGITLERLLTELQQHYGWDGLAQKVAIQCFQKDPSIASSLKFLRRTPWARSKVEHLYLQLPITGTDKTPTAPD